MMHLNGYRMMNIKNVANVMESFIGDFMEIGNESVSLCFVNPLGVAIDIF